MECPSNKPSRITGIPLTTDDKLMFRAEFPANCTNLVTRGLFLSDIFPKLTHDEV
jgi:hypothetical protein